MKLREVFAIAEGAEQAQAFKLIQQITDILCNEIPEGVPYSAEIEIAVHHLDDLYILLGKMNK